MNEVINKYRFLEVDSQGKECHLHQLWSDRKQDWENLTGTTTVLEVLGKPLTWWASGLAVKEFSGIEDCKVLTKIKNGKATRKEIEETRKTVADWLGNYAEVSADEYIQLCIKAYGAHASDLKDTASEGTDLHADLEYVVKYFMEHGKYPEEVLPEKVGQFILWAGKNVKRYLGSEVHCYDEMLFIGGVCDVIAEMNDGSYVIIDFKRAKGAYFSHFAQCGGYHLQLMKNGGFDKNGNKILELDKEITKYIVIPFGQPVFEPTVNNNINGFQKSFASLVTVYREKGAFENK